MSALTPQPTYLDLMASVGFLLLYWGSFELADRHAKSRGIVYSNEIDDEISRVRAIRNLVAHGIFNGSADPLAKEESHISCATQTGETVHLTYSMLYDTYQAIDRLRLQIEALNRRTIPR